MKKISIQGSNSKANSKKILFLGYNENETCLINALKKKHCKLTHSKDSFNYSNEFDLIISFGYRRIIKKELIEQVKCPIINLHISYLPYNKGTHPNFWSFYDNTPSGVTIHIIDEGVDTGPIIYQKYVNFDKGEVTFKQTYKRLFNEIENLFLKNIDNIIDMNWIEKKQRGEGTFRKLKDLPKEFRGWDTNIQNEIERLYSLKASLSNLNLFEINEDDCKDIWIWRNDPNTRKMSKNSRIISWDIHKKWFEKTLINKNSTIFIGRLSNGDKIGMCRFETDVTKKEINVSINLKKEFRNKKLSKVLLENAIRLFKNKKKFALTATIKKNNISSIICFNYCGFKYQSEDNSFFYYKIVINQ